MSKPARMPRWLHPTTCNMTKNASSITLSFSALHTCNMYRPRNATTATHRQPGLSGCTITQRREQGSPEIHPLARPARPPVRRPQPRPPVHIDSNMNMEADVYPPREPVDAIFNSDAFRYLHHRLTCLHFLHRKSKSVVK